MDEREVEIRKYAPLMAPILTQMGGGDSDYMYLLSLLDTERARADALIAKHGSCEDAYEELRALARELAVSLSGWIGEWGWGKKHDALLARAREAGLLKEEK